MNNNNNFTTTKIDFINFIDKSIIKQGKINYFRFIGWDKAEVINFLTQIPDETIITVFPFVSPTGRPEDTYLRLSNVFLVTNKSTKFILDQWHLSGFQLKQDRFITFSFKFKRVTFSSYF